MNPAPRVPAQDPKKYQKCVTVAKSSVQGPGFWVQNVTKVWPASQIQGPWSGNTALREKEPCTGSYQIGTWVRWIRRSPPVDSLNGLNSFLPPLEPSSETLLDSLLLDPPMRILYYWVQTEGFITISSIHKDSLPLDPPIRILYYLIHT